MRYAILLLIVCLYSLPAAAQLTGNLRRQALSLRIGKGNEELKKGNRAAALQIYLDVLKETDTDNINGFRSSALTGISLVHFTSGRPKEALQAADQALRSSDYTDAQKGAAEAYQARAHARAVLGQVREAVSDYMAAVTANPTIANEYWYQFDRCGTPVSNDMPARVDATVRRRCPMFSLGSLPVDPAVVPIWYPMFVQTPLLFSGGNVTVYGRTPSLFGRPSNAAEWCNRILPISVTLRISDPGFVFSGSNAGYRRVVEEMLLPAIRNNCGFSQVIEIANEAGLPQPRAVNIIQVRAAAQGGWQYTAVGNTRVESLASLEQEQQGRVARQANGGDPTSLKRFPFPSGLTNAMRICNEAGGTIKVAMVWQNTIGNALRSTLGGPFAPSGFEAAGFADVPPGSCQRIGFGAMNGPVSGHLSVFRFLGGKWIATEGGTGGRRNSDAELLGAPRWICWPEDSAQSVDPASACEGDRRSVRFGLWFKRSAAAEHFTITVGNSDIGMSAEKWEWVR